MLRVDGPAAIEIQHMSQVILERVNRFFGFGAIDRIAIRQAPLPGQPVKPDRTLDPQAVQQVADTLPEYRRGAENGAGAAWCGRIKRK